MYVKHELSSIFSERKKHRRRGWVLASMVMSSAGMFFIGSKMVGVKASTSVPVAIALSPPDILQSPISRGDNFFDATVRDYDEIRSGENLYTALRRLKVSPQRSSEFSSAIGGEVNLRALQPGDVLMIESENSSLQPSAVGGVSGLSVSLDAVAVELFNKSQEGNARRIRAEIDRENARVSVSVHQPSLHVERAMLSGTVKNSIYNAMVATGGSAQLVNDFSDIFAWQFDFYKDSRESDRYQMIVERNVSQGRVISHGKILAAEYESGSTLFRAFYFESRDGLVSGYFDPDGQSLKNAFLKSPIKLASISSSFGMRYHPIQRRMKPHDGVDYGAAPGTPIRAVASGVVKHAGRNRFNGNWVEIKHLNGYETVYLHASKLALGVKVGARIEQGQVIAYVGKTGMATGYHLHFGMKKNGRYVDPTKQRFTRSAGVPANYLAEFNRHIDPMIIAFGGDNTDVKDVLALYAPEGSRE